MPLSRLLRCVAVTALSCVAVAAVSPSSVQLSATGPLTHFTFGSCNNQDRPQHLWEHVHALHSQLWLWLGDVIYADRAVLEFFRQPAILTEMKQMYQKQHDGAEYTQLRQSDTKIIGMYDDHDYGVNDGDASYVDKEAARHLFLDFIGEPADSGRRRREGVYESYRWGATTKPSGAASAPGVPAADGRQTKLLVLDGRYFQNRSADDMLGPAQWLWLEEQLNDAAPTDLFIITSGLQLVFTDKRIGEGWRLFPKSRAKIFRLISQRKHNRDAMVMFLSGDVHFAEADVTYSCEDASSGEVRVTPFYDFTSSGMTHSVGTQVTPRVAEIAVPWFLHKRPSWAAEMDLAASIEGAYFGLNFGEVHVEWDQQRIVVTIRDRDGKPTPQRYTLPFSALRASTLDASAVPASVAARCAAESVRAVSPAMWVIPGTKAGIVISAAVLTALALMLRWMARAMGCGNDRSGAAGRSPDSRKRR